MRRLANPRIWFSIALAAALMAGGLTSASSAAADPAVVGSWSPEIPLGLIGIHAALLSDGNVLYYELPGSTTNSRAAEFNPTTDAVTEVDPSNINWSVFCSGITHLPDGRILSTGGEPDKFPTRAPLGTGTPDAAIYDPTTKTWSAAAPMANPRWYPSNVQMPDGTTLVMGGKQIPHGTNFMVQQMESYNPTTNKWTTLPASADMTGLYPRAMVMPNGDVLNAGQQQLTSEFDPTTNTWTPIAKMHFGARTAGGVVLLPGLHQILTAGGRNGAKGVTNTAEILDMNAANPQWQYTGSMAIARDFENLVLLPDGTVLAVGGGQLGNFGDPVKTAELYNPATGTWSTMATQAGQRTYHSSAVLLPDGRVASAGSNSGLPEQTTVEIYSPPYLFSGNRPTVTSAPSAINYGGTFDVQSPDASSSTPITRVALMKLGAVTHGWSEDQRYVDLPFTTSGNTLTINEPANANIAPPGPYMLFLVNSDGVPSVAPIMSVAP